MQRIHTEVYHPVNQDGWLYILLELEVHYTLIYSIEHYTVIHVIQPRFHLEFASDCYVGMFFSRHFQGQRFNIFCASSHNHNSPILLPKLQSYNLVPKAGNHPTTFHYLSLRLLTCCNSGKFDSIVAVDETSMVRSDG